MKKKTIIAIATLLAFGQGGWADGTVSFPLHYNATTNPEDGSADHPYQIQSVSDLNTLASDVNSGTTYSGKYFKLTADLDYSDVELFDTDEDGTADSNFTTIGYGDESDGNCFVGIFDGNGKYIKGITVNTPSAAGVALFGYIAHPAEIRNLTLKDCSFTGNFEVGAIAGASSGSATNSTFGIYDCTVESTVNVTAVTTTIESEDYPGTYAGGIIGFCGSLTVSDCTSAAVVKGDESVGGIAGHITGSTLGGVIKDCFFSGSVTGGTEATEVGTIVGGRGPMDGEEGTNGTINLTLFDADGDAISNATRLSNYNGLEANVTLSGRTLYKDNSWNTICLPFAMTAAQVTAQLAPAVVDDKPQLMTLKTAELSGSTLTLDFEYATAIEAGKPYIIKWTSNSEWKNPTFEGVTVSSAVPTDVEGTAANFHGIYSPYSTGGENKSMLYLGASNTLYYPNANMTINAFLAYFTLNGITAGDLPSEARAFVLNFGDESTGIISLSTDSKDSKDNAAWYTLDGRKLNGKPAKKGLYINNGKKIVIK